MRAELKSVTAQPASAALPGCLPPRAADGRALRLRRLVSAIACLLPGAALAGPENGQVVAGAATIDKPNANTTVINQSSAKSVINWKSFSIGKQEAVEFRQPGKSSISLNRVVGGDPSSILGKLSANGQVYLVNPNGIYFGRGAQVDVSGIVASVLDISTADFMNGNFVFEGEAGADPGKVINDGIINARNEGYVVLMGDYSENNGVIEARMGKVVLASGSHLTMDISGNSLISVAVNEATVKELAGVSNTGEIYADGGRVIMTAKVADDLIGSAVNNQGLVRANSIVEKDGAIFLTGIGGRVTNSGTLDASAAAGSNVDGGGVLVYSDRDIALPAGAAIHARGDGDGGGGAVRVIAGEVLDFQQGAEINVAGRPRRGGFVEVSGHDGLKLRGEVEVGTGGSLVIDPAIFNINSGSGSPSVASSTGNVGNGFIANQLIAGNNVFVVADSLITVNSSGQLNISATNAGAGDLNLVIGTVAGGGGTLGFPASNGQCNSAGFCLGGGGTSLITPGGNGSINLANLFLNLAGGLNVAGGTTAGNVTLGGINAGGNVSIQAGGNVDLQGFVGAAGTDFSVNAGGDIAVNNDIGGSESFLDATVSLNAGGSVAVDADIFAGNGDINLNADVDGDNAGDVTINGSTTGARRILTFADVNVSGQNFNVNGADFGTNATSLDQSAAVTVKSDRLVVNITGDMTLQAGRINLNIGSGGTSSSPGGITAAVDASVNVSATSLVDITANNLAVRGGNASASVSGSSAQSSARALANAELAATGGSMNLNLGGSLVLQAGNAAATLRDRNNADAALAEANASLKASGAVTIVAPTGLVVSAGSAAATARGTVGTAGLPVAARANATLDAGTNLDLAIASGNLRLTGGSATASALFGGIYAAAATADALVTANGNLAVSLVGGDVDINGGSAAANASGSCSDCAADASAKARVFGGTLSFNNIGGDLNMLGGNVDARGQGSDGDCIQCTVSGDASAQLDGGQVTIAAVTNINLTGRNAASRFLGNVRNGDARADANAKISASGNVSISATNLVSLMGGAALVTGNWSSATNMSAAANANASVDAGANLTLNAAGGLNVSGGSASATPSISGAINGSASALANAELVAGGMANVSVSSGSITLTGGSANPNSGSSGTAPVRRASANAQVAANTLQMMANTDVNGNSARIDAGGVFIQAGGNISLVNSLTTVGGGNAPGVSGDALLFSVMNSVGIGLPNNSGPNLLLQAGNTVFTGDIAATASNAYFWFAANSLGTGSYTVPAGPLLVQMSPNNPIATIGFEDSSATTEMVNYSNAQHVSGQPMTTVAIGSAQQSGPITVGANGPIDIGSKNIIFLTTPNDVDSPNNIITTGIVATSGSVASVDDQSEVFVTPRLENFDVNMETWLQEVERRRRQLVDYVDDDHGMCVAL
jgi:filamentous hemagglutinin family protein